MIEEISVKLVKAKFKKYQSHSLNNVWEARIAWFKSTFLLNIQMYNMSSLHKYNSNGLIKTRNLFTKYGRDYLN